MNKKKGEILEYISTFHPNRVSCAGGSGRFAGSWSTYIGKGRAGRKLIRAASLEDLLEKLAEYYGLKEKPPEPKKKKAPTLEDYFPYWLDWKAGINGNKAQTRYHNAIDFKTYVGSAPLAKIPLAKITTEDLDAWARELLISKPMTAKRFNTIKLAVTGPLELAAVEGLIHESPWKPERMRYKRLFKSARKAPSSEKIFYEDEIREIVEKCLADFETSRNLSNLALVINFDLGLRVGELSALKWEDIDWRRKVVNIRRQEDTSGEVEEYVKSDSAAGYRELPLNDPVMDTLRRIRKETGALSGYIFVSRDGKRKTSVAISNRLIYVQRGKDETRPVKRIHCQRRTVATRIAKALGLEAARQWLGHTDIQTTLRYIYTMETTESMRAYSNEASAMNLVRNNGGIISLTSVAK